MSLGLSNSYGLLNSYSDQQPSAVILKPISSENNSCFVLPRWSNGNTYRILGIFRVEVTSEQVPRYGNPLNGF